ncbi:MAG: LysE family translocator, partial [Lapillicoccus sp.]
STLAAFTLSALVFILLPGPAMLFLVARGISEGRRVGAVSALGIESATAVYVVATALGLTALLAASTLAFATIRYAGAAYLVYLGVRTIRGRREVAAAARPVAGLARSWAQGFVVGIGNPKAALFFLAFFPQFLHPEAGSVVLQVLVLGAILVAIGTVLDVSYGVFGGVIRTHVGTRRGAARRGRVAVGLTYIGLGGFAAATGHRSA